MYFFNCLLVCLSIWLFMHLLIYVFIIKRERERAHTHRNKQKKDVRWKWIRKKMRPQRLAVGLERKKQRVCGQRSIVIRRPKKGPTNLIASFFFSFFLPGQYATRECHNTVRTVFANLTNVEWLRSSVGAVALPPTLHGRRPHYPDTWGATGNPVRNSNKKCNFLNILL